MVRTLPKSGLIIVTVNAAVLPYAPEPLAAGLVNQIVLDEFPRHDGIFDAVLTTAELPEVEIAHDAFCLHPPVPVGIDDIT